MAFTQYQTLPRDLLYNTPKEEWGKTESCNKLKRENLEEYIN